MSKKYAFVPMGDEDLGPAKVVKKEKKEKSRKRTEKSSSSRRERRSRSRSPRPRHRDEPHHSSATRRKRDNEADFDDRWGDEEQDEEEERNYEQQDFLEPAAKKLKISDDENLTEEQRDKREVDAFAKRILSRDDDSTKKEGRKPSVKDIASRNPTLAVSDLRERSRQDYLQKRGTIKLELLRKQVQDETDEIRSGVRLTERELASFKKNRELLRLADERTNIDDHVEGFTFADEMLNGKQKEEALYKRAVHRKGEKVVTEGMLFEEEQVAKSKAQIKSYERVDEGEYDYLFDPEQTIKYIADSKLPGQKLTKEQQELAKKILEAESQERSIQQVRESLPAYKYKEQFIDALKEHQILVVVGETGSGKTTQLTQFCHEAGFTTEGIVGCTQPRRVAAMSVAARVSDEMGSPLGQKVGYSIRFDNKTSDKTVICYLTDGLLLRDAMQDPLLQKYSVIMIDEAHERNINTDILLALLKDICRARPDLKLVISSATLNSTLLSEYYDGCPIFSIPGRTFPVDMYYTDQPEANYLTAAITTVFQIHASQDTQKGDILVFLTGQEEINAAEEQILEISKKLGKRIKPLVVVPIYANLDSEQQNKIFEKVDCRKVILATNIAETSITLDGIVYCIDAGFVKQNSFNPDTGMSSLAAVPISRASANQRAGRAGRTGPGKCFRLYTKWAYMNEMEESTTPEIQRSDLISPVLLLKSLGINDLLDFDFLSPPSSEMLVSALGRLYALGALNSAGSLTVVGRKLAEIPTDPAIAKSLLSADKYGCVEEVLTIVSLLGEGATLWLPGKKENKVHFEAAKARFNHEAGDMLTLLNVYEAWEQSDYSPIWCRENFLQARSLSRARDVREQLVKLCERVEVTPSSCGANNSVPIAKSLLSGFFENVGRLSRDGQSYSTLKKRSDVYIHPSSSFFLANPPQRLICWHELVLTSKEFVRGLLKVDDLSWLNEVAPHYYKREDLDKLEEKKPRKGREI